MKYDSTPELCGVLGPTELKMPSPNKSCMLLRNCFPAQHVISEARGQCQDMIPFTFLVNGELVFQYMLHIFRIKDTNEARVPEDFPGKCAGVSFWKL